MSKVRVAINGFGRIGRSAFKILHARNDVEVVAINDLADNSTLAHLLKYDSNYPAHDWYQSIEANEKGLVIDDNELLVFEEKDPSSLPWAAHDIDVVIESTGLFTDPEKARAHVKNAGAKKVIISAPAKGEGSKTIVLGVNDDAVEAIGDVADNASCTTNNIAPVAHIIESVFGIEKAMMTTIHSYTSDQRLQDAPHKDLRRARAAAENIIPTTTGAAIAASKTVPALEGVFDGISIRVPTPVVSLSDITFLLKRDATKGEINDALKKAANEPYYQGILGVTEEELVSSDFIGNSHSAIVDLNLTNVVGGNLVKVVAWYDNEWGYSNRLVELTVDIGKALKK